MTAEEEVKYLRKVIRKLIFSNVQMDYQEDKVYINFGVYKIKMNPHEDIPMSEVVDYFMGQIAYIDAAHKNEVPK